VTPGSAAKLGSTGGKNGVGHEGANSTRGLEFGQGGAREQPRTAYRVPFMPPAYWLGHVPARGLGHHPEFIQPHHRVVAHFEFQARLLLELSQEVRLLLHEVQGATSGCSRTASWRSLWSGTGRA